MLTYRREGVAITDQGNTHTHVYTHTHTHTTGIYFLLKRYARALCAKLLNTSTSAYSIADREAMSTNVLTLRVNCSSDISSTITKDKIENFTELLSQVSSYIYT